MAQNNAGRNKIRVCFKKFATLLKKVTNKLYFLQGGEKAALTNQQTQGTEKKTNQMQRLGVFCRCALIFIQML